MKILAYTSPARGHLYPLVPILDELAGRGHVIAVRTLASQVGLMTERGFDAAPISPAIEALEHDDFRARTPPAKLQRAMRTFTTRAPLEVTDLRSAIAADRPDVVLVDGMAWGASAVAEASGGPWAQWFPYPLPVSSRDAPPFGPGLTPARGPLGRVRDRLLGSVLGGTMARATLPALAPTRADVGVPAITTADGLFTRAPLLLYMTAEPFDYPRSDWPDSVCQVGPVLLGPALGRAVVARRGDAPDRARQHLVGVSGRRPAREHRARGARRRGRRDRRHPAVGGDPARGPGQRPRGGVHPARTRLGAGSLRDHPRGRRRHPEGPRPRRARVRRAVRPRPVRGRPEGGGRLAPVRACRPAASTRTGCAQRYAARWRCGPARSGSRVRLRPPAGP